MLGRQQIAGVPTAISELFKNAHDAYATRVQADFVRRDQLLVVRDNGIGMSRADILDRWLVLGTESKTDSARTAPPPPGRARRALLGEKGIGRLAIAAIGPQVLMLTRPASHSDSGTAALVNWSLFEVPGIALDEISVPLQDLPSNRAVTPDDVAFLVSEAIASLDIIELEPLFRARILQELETFALEPDILEGALPGPDLLDTSSGTQFYIKPAVETLATDLDVPLEVGGQAPLIMTLLGFSNTMTRKRSPDGVTVSFVDHKPRAAPRDVLAEEEFFTPNEFASADHHIVGVFDEYGQFDGTVQIYDRDPQHHKVTWKEARGTETECGPFRLELAVIQGQAAASRMRNEEWVPLNRKTDALGGLYIYSDGVRVLPYGRNDYDWLDIERNRTKSAAYYYFSYRNMFGVIDLDSEHNEALQQKAGREGFAENRAYRQFQGIFRNFFLQIAADFFREDGVAAETFFQERQELTKLEQAQRRRRQQQTTKKREVRAALDRSFRDLEASVPETEVERVLEEFLVALDTARTHTAQDEIANGLLEAEVAARRRFRQAKERQQVSRPRGFALSRDVERDLRAHAVEMRRLDQDVILPAEQILESELEEAARLATVAIDRRVRFDRALEQLASAGHKRAREAGKALDQQADAIGKRARTLSKSARVGMAQYVQELGAGTATADLAALSEAQFVERRSAVEEAIADMIEAQEASLQGVTSQLESIDWPSNGNGPVVTRDDVTEALESEVLALRERSEADLELAQLGMALEVVNHEFDSTVRAVRSQLRRLQTWTETNPALQGVYDGLRTSFDHLDGYLTLFTPLQRRLYRKRVEISGGGIEQFLRDLFSERLTRDEVELRATANFRRYRFNGYPSTFYPVFVNLVDNALFWTGDRSGPRWIELDADDGAMTVSDSGPGVPLRDREAIFDLGFTRKPGGRGAGLRIARDVLAAENYRLELMRTRGHGATFVIRPEGDAEDDG